MASESRIYPVGIYALACAAEFWPTPKIFGFDVVQRFDEVKVTAVTFDM